MELSGATRDHYTANFIFTCARMRTDAQPAKGMAGIEILRFCGRPEEDVARSCPIHGAVACLDYIRVIRLTLSHHIDSR